MLSAQWTNRSSLFLLFQRKRTKIHTTRPLSTLFHVFVHFQKKVDVTQPDFFIFSSTFSERKQEFSVLWVNDLGVRGDGPLGQRKTGVDYLY